MPHFFAKTCNAPAPVANGACEIVFEAAQILGKSEGSLVLTKIDGENILLSKHFVDGKFLVKYNKFTKSPNLSHIARALRFYANASKAEIISSNLPKDSPSQIRVDSKDSPSRAGLDSGLDLDSSLDSKDSNLDSKDSRLDSKDSKNCNNFLLSSSELCARLAHESAFIEIGFGSGRHLLHLAKNNPLNLIIGIEIYRPAIAQVLRQIELQNLKNLFLVNGDCRILFEILPPNSARAIFLHFPVPWDKSPTKRIFSAHFLASCARILGENGFLELRTDSKEYYSYALQTARECEFDIKPRAQNEVISKYEARWIRQNKDIFCARFYASARFNEVRESHKNVESIEKILGEISLARLQNAPNLAHLKKDYFLNIKNAFAFEGGFILFIICGAYRAPSKFYLLCYNGGKGKVLGDFVPCDANLRAMKLLMRLYGK